MAVETEPRTDSPYKTIDIDPELLVSGKTSTRLAGTDILSFGVQVIANGGETNLHAHNAQDAVWVVLGGKARFYGPGDVVIAEMDKHQALLIPRGEPYWFESASDENLVILRFAATDKQTPNTRNDVGKRTFAVGDANDGIKREVVRTGKRFRDA